MLQVPMGILLQPLQITTTILFVFLAVFRLIHPVLALDPFTESLLSLKSEVIDGSNTLSDWVLPPGVNSSAQSSQIHACSWAGVRCNENSSMVVGLDLSMKNLGGVLSGRQFGVFVDLLDLNLSYNSFSEKLPSGIFNLSSLRSLDMSRNNFSGEFPKGISNLGSLVILDAFSNSFSGPLPSDVSKLQSLKTLNFAGSYFSGPIPSEYGSLENLEFIHLAGNLLSGKLPLELGKLRAVTHMEIGYNSYEGTIPWQFGNMSELQYLDIAGANLSGPIPRELSNLTKLQSLFLFRNLLDGWIPHEFSRISSLTSLDLSDNLLSGPIPESFSELKNLRLLSLMYNELSGTVPQGLAKLPALETLLIWNNYFNGSLPEDLGRHSNLKYLDVSTNNFVGAIPPGICSGGMLSRLILFSNSFTGGLNPSISSCPSLIRLRLEDNTFSGEISLNFSNLPDITYVDLSMNQFIGGIPNDLAQASKLQYFNVSGNPELGGIIPEKTWSMLSLQNFSASNCRILGNVPSFQNCKSVSVIELSVNNLAGFIPDSVSNCKGLVKMDLAFNNLTGQIPAELASLPVIDVLDLSHNGFNGPIPSEFGSSSSLKLLNVSFNDLSGSIPKEKKFWAMDSSAFTGNPKLCGAPIRACHHGPGGLELGSRRTQKLAWVLITCGVIVLFITGAIFGVLHFRRGGKGQWKMVSFSGIPQFTANDVLRSFDSNDAMEMVPPMPGSVCKVVLPTGITVSVKRINWRPERVTIMSEFINRLGNARHKNLTRLLGFCYNKHMAYLLYDYLPNGNLSEKIRVKRDWATKYKIVTGIARGLCFLHHNCYPAIPHGDLKASNIVFDENMEPHLIDFGIKSLTQLDNSSSPTRARRETGELEIWTKEEVYMDIYNFGKLVMEILTNGRAEGVEAVNMQTKPKDALLREILNENDIPPSNAIRDEVKVVLEVGLLCTRSRALDRPSMEDAVKLLSGLKVEGK
ncbi:leucine-rich repeat receptor-like protein kinase TDR [Ipomoea triloba]|uniref:leucine-rich repeat receptor-like protein kinase TDR n=1 Tax=Ipomoea triloba TaxID=35885 RepID=UPI00125E1FAF|nr:leucine-rich repeat receptor-like protein kinase TDR [Ipomoea triloba]